MDTRTEQPEGAAGTNSYRLVMYGGGFEDLDRMQLRERIRSGEITESTEISTDGEQWFLAGELPELKRYFSLVSTQFRVTANPSVARATRPVETMGRRIVQGLLYPIAGLEIATLLGFAILSALPVFGILASLAAGVYTLAIIRSSADGKTKMPPIVDTSDIGTLVTVALKTLFITLISLMPVILWGAFTMREVASGQPNLPLLIGGLLVAFAISALYYPACLATVAVWDSALDAINPMYVFRVARTIGVDYLLVVVMWFVATAFAALASSPMISPFAQVPIVGGILSSMLSMWSLFYVSHLLGYSVFRHSSDLGWD